MEYTIIGEKDFKTTDWSGGKTEQFFIYPEKSELNKRDFIFRISSATFTSTESIFSDFTGYQRYILPLRGELYLNHCLNDDTLMQDRKTDESPLYERLLKKYEIEHFSGAWRTYSKNSPDLRDFNLIVKNNIQCNLRVLYNAEDTYIPKKNGLLCIFSLSPYDLTVNFNKDKRIEIEENRLMVIKENNTDYAFNIHANLEPVIVCEVNV